MSFDPLTEWRMRMELGPGGRLWLGDNRIQQELRHKQFHSSSYRMTLTDSLGLAIMYAHEKTMALARHAQECIEDSGFEVYREYLLDYWKAVS